MRKGLRLFAWYRVVPIALMFAVGAVSFVYSYAPSPLFGLLYPLDYEDYITDSSECHTVDPFLVAAVIETESNWNAQAVSSKEAQGLMQLLPETAEDMAKIGLVDGARFDPDELDDPAPTSSLAAPTCRTSSTISTARPIGPSRRIMPVFRT